MKLLLLGSNGQLGRELRRRLAPIGELTALEHRSGDFCGDLTDLPGIEKTMRRLRPDVIVNAAAYTAVDRAENEPELAHQVNALAPRLLAHEAAELGALMVHYSTDYVFDGSGDRPWCESDVAAPLSVYGRTKLAGDHAVLAASSRHLILRTGWVYGDGGNFLRSVLARAQQSDRLEVVDDQIGAPTSADLLADVTLLALTRVLGEPSLGGLYHLAAAGQVSRHAYARHIVDYARRSPNAPRIQAREVAAVPTAAGPGVALRPLNGRLDCSKITAALGLSLPRWEAGVERAVDVLLDGAAAAR